MAKKRRKPKAFLHVPKRPGGRKVRRNASVTMPLKMFRRALHAAKTGAKAIIKARVH